MSEPTSAGNGGGAPPEAGVATTAAADRAAARPRPVPGSSFGARAWRLLQPLAWVLATLAIALGALWVGANWLLRSPEGTAWALARVPGVQIEGLQGALLGDRLVAERVVVRWGTQGAQVTIDGLRGEGLRVRWHPGAGSWFGFTFDHLQARRVHVDTGAPGPRPTVLPRTLQLPLQLQAARVDIGELQIETLPPMRDVQARDVRLWEQAARGYAAEALAFDWGERARIEGRFALASEPPYRLEAEARARAREVVREPARVSDRAPDRASDRASTRASTGEQPAAAPAWTAQARAKGTLAQFALEGTLRGVAVRAGAPSPAVDVRATVTPLEAWPLGALDLATRGLDLSALASGAPQTALSGHASIDLRGLDRPIGAVIDFENALPGRWDQSRVPARRLQATLKSPDANRQRLVVERFDLQLATQGNVAAGRIQGRADWRGAQLEVEAKVDTLRPRLLDGRAAEMVLTGPVQATVSGLPPPDPQAWNAWSSAHGAARVGAQWHAQLAGSIDGSPAPVKLLVDGRAEAGHFVLRELQAEIGSARAQLALDAQAVQGAGWRVRSSGQLDSFDPIPWLRDTVPAAWRQGPHRLSGAWGFDLVAPAQAATLAPVALLQALAGSGTVRLDRGSQLAGVPLALTAQLSNQPGAAAPSRVQGELTVGGNRVVFDGSGNPAGDGRADQMRVQLEAEQLAALAPLVRLVPAAAEWLPRSGRASGAFTLVGRWPELRTEGSANVQALGVGALGVGKGRVEWRFATVGEQPVRLVVDADDTVWQDQRLTKLHADVEGTARAHTIAIDAVLPGGPPPALQQAAGLRAGEGASVRVRGEGQWTADAQGGRWSGRVHEALLGAWNGARNGGGHRVGNGVGNGAVNSAVNGGRSTAAAVAAAAASTLPGSIWVDARDLRAELRIDRKAGLTEFNAAAGTVRLADTATLRWDEVRVDLRGARPTFALRADVEPFPVAPLLARNQPAVGWAGDLRVAARIDLRAAETLDADITLERRGGDLWLTGENASQPFGLTELRAVVSAHGGNWQVAGAFAGKTLGEASARLSLRPRPEQRWPSADTPIDGVVEGRVANLGVWGAWVPPGWRLSGEVRASASVMGRLGAPDYAGTLNGTDIAVRNLLQGVDVHGGNAVIRLAGAQAEIERFTLRGGDGTVTVAGRAQLTGTPRADLELKAERFRVLGRVDRRVVVSGALAVGLSAETLRAEGQVKIDEGLLDLSRKDAPSLDDDVTIREARADDDFDAAPLPPRSRRVNRIAIDVEADAFKVRGRGIDTALSGKVRLGSAGPRLTVNGIVRADGGTYQAYGQKLDIDRGVAIFSGDADNPTLDILALRPNLDTPVGVSISGSMQNPRVRLYSAVAMSETDKLSWLVMGRASDGLGRADTALLQRAAVALLAGEGEAPTDALLRSLGIDEFGVRQSDGEVRETIITLGKQLSRRWYVGYERGVNATTGTWQLIYRIAQRFTLRAQSGLDNSLDLIWVWRRGEPPKEPVAAPKGR